MTSRSIHETQNTKPRSPLGLLLDSRGTRPSWLAAQLQVDRAQVTRWCTGKSPIPKYHVQPIADALGVEPEEFAA